MPLTMIQPFHQAHGKPSSQGGFTLLELLIVVAIMMLVAGGAIFVYDDLQRRAELDMARRQMATLRDALLRFRTDMGYFPGEGTYAPANLNLTSHHFVDGESANNNPPSTAALQRWAKHPMNFWMLFEQPVPSTTGQNFNFNRSTGRGWRGPYLGAGFGWKLDAAGRLEGGFVTGERSNRVTAVADLIRRPGAQTGFLQWVSENVGTTSADVPQKTPQTGEGAPIAFLIDNRVSTPNTVIYRLVSAGNDGIFQTTGVVPAVGSDDIVIEVTRRSTL